MSLRTARRESPVILVAVLVAALALLVTGLYVLGTMEFAWPPGDEAGQTPVAGIVGLAVMLVTLVLLFELYGEMTEPEAAAEEFPPGSAEE